MNISGERVGARWKNVYEKLYTAKSYDRLMFVYTQVWYKIFLHTHKFINNSALRIME